MNINRDYLIINDVKKSNITLDNGSMFFYITDKNTQNIFVNLVINVSNNDLIQKYANIENAEDYTLTMNIVKPDNTYKVVEGKLHDKEKAIFEFNLKSDCCDKIGTYRCELLTKCNINEQEEITTSNKITYKVKSSVLNDLDDIVEAPEYPLVIQLFDKLSDIDQYEEDRRANEVARQLAEEQRQTRFDALDADMVHSIQTMDDKVVDVENRISAKEQAVDKLIVDTKVDIDDYKVAKDTEIDEYKTAKDQQIDQAIADQNNKIDDAIANQNNKIDTAVAEQNNRIGIVEASDNTQNTRLDALEAKDIAHETSITNIEAKNVEQDNRLDSIEAVNVSQDNRLDAIEVKNQQQDDRLLDVEKVNKRQDMDLKCLFAESKNNMIDVTEEGNSVHLQNSTVGYTLIDEIQGNTMVNCNKEPDKEIILNGNINTQGYSDVTLTEGVDGGLVDVALEGNTMVNVCDQKDPVAITKAYTVETGNHIALQGEYDGKCRPVITGNTLVNLLANEINNQDSTLVQSTNDSSVERIVAKYYYTYYPKHNTDYTLIFMASNVSVTDGGDNGSLFISLCEGSRFTARHSVINGINIVKLNNTNTEIENSMLWLYFNAGVNCSATISNIILLEGDYTNKPIPGYFSGLQSSFEDKVVTQEMVNSGEEIAGNLGKYRVEYKVTGKNKFDGNYLLDTYTNVLGGISSSADWCTTNYIRVTPNTTYIQNHYNPSVVVCTNFYDINKNVIGNVQSRSYTTPYNCAYLRTSWKYSTNDLNFQLEEGTETTPYEPYKEYTKTFYLNSPLLEGDTIEQQGNNVVHVHRSELRAYETDDELTLLTDMTNTLVAKATPTYEVISQNDTILCDSYVNGHLDVDSVVPIERVDFLHFEKDLTYLYANTQYAVQFVSDAVSKVDITLGGAKLLNQDVVVGTNKYMITTPSTLVDNKLIINGVGANIKEVVVTNTDREFGYFEGMKSVGEGGNLVITSSNSDNSLSNTQTLTHAPLRSVGETKDRYVLLNGNWYIERKCGIRVHQEGDKDNYKTDLINTVYPLEMPAYEEIDYNPLEVYSSTTHITTNSVIPTNITVKNHGYNCLLKPSTTYTISSSLGLNTVTTGADIGDSCLRFMDTDTSDVTTMKNVLVLEGDWTTKADLIPANFSGIESAFEQEYDEAVGKYKVKAKVVGKNLININDTKNIIIGQALAQHNGLYRDPNYNIIKNVPVTPGKTYSFPNIAWSWTLDKNKKKIGNLGVLSHYTIPHNCYYLSLTYLAENQNTIQLEQGTEATEYEPYKENYIEFYMYEPLRGIGDAKDKVYVKNDKVVVERKCGQRAYQDGDFGTYPTDKINTVYPLAEPTYEEVEYKDTKLFIESFKNSTLFYNSNIPVTSKLYYSYSVPLVDTVAQTANVTDQQDSMIIDLATQCAVMEMMLM